jgi:hypothetical protein
MSDTSYYDPTDETDDPDIDTVSGEQFDADELLPNVDDNERGAPVNIKNDYLFTVDRAANSGQTDQTPVGNNGQPPVARIIGGQAARRSVTLLNVGDVEVQYGYNQSLKWGHGFPLAVGAAVTLPVRCAIYATTEITDGTAPGLLAWDAIFEDG